MIRSSTRARVLPVWFRPLSGWLLLTMAGCSGNRGAEIGRGLGTNDAMVVAEDASEDASADAGCLDMDQDQYGRGCAQGPDCDDANPALHVGREVFVDGDDDTYGLESTYVCLSSDGLIPPGYALRGGDCNDESDEVNPGIGSDGCDDIDVDCDDKVDEDRTTLEVTCGMGACRGAGESRCTDQGVVNTCLTAQPSGDDRDCNGKDDDCDGTIDDGYQPTVSRCERDGCSATGTVHCLAGMLVDDCRAPVRAPNDVTCDGRDDDCDGQVDEDFAPQSTGCGAGACLAGGETSCQNGQVVNSCMAGSGMGNDDDCDGVDDDCDGTADDGFGTRPSTCGAGACRAMGTVSCQGGVVVDSCASGQAGGADTICNGIDDDCNGEVDEDYRGPSRSCGVGACRSAAADVCVNGRVESTCNAGAPAASDTTCDGIDDDCDGTADEDFVARDATCGIGACQNTGRITCQAGQEQNSCAPRAPGVDNTCNGIDEDCNGVADNGYVPTPTTCGAGACAATGSMRCVAGALRDTCAEGQPGGADSTCDGIDSDCSGTADEDYVPRSETCGVGECRRTITTSCVRGVETVCVPGQATGDDSDCDNRDDNCNGTNDENYPAANTSCGTGVCARTGRRTCTAGSVVDSCQPARGAATDDNCDGVDDDCNGAADEDHRISTTCGLGVCARTGVETCVNARPVDSCVPGTRPSSTDATCDNRDENCSGRADEDYVPEQTTCGIGECANTGLTTCVGGVVGRPCTERPATPDTDCDARDDDCDGQADDDYLRTLTRCGTGVCAATGQMQCIQGQQQDTCTAGAPTQRTDSLCNGLDDDCNGQVDEDFQSTTTSCGTGRCATTGMLVCDMNAMAPRDTCVAQQDICRNETAAFCANGQICTGRMTCSGTPCNCTTPSACIAGAPFCSGTQRYQGTIQCTNTPCMPISDACSPENPYCNGQRQQCTGHLACAGSECGCTAQSDCLTSGQGPVCNTAGQLCTGNTRCTGALCDCIPPSCQQERAYCGANNQVCTGRMQCTNAECDCTAPSCQRAATFCTGTVLNSRYTVNPQICNGRYVCPADGSSPCECVTPACSPIAGAAGVCAPDGRFCQGQVVECRRLNDAVNYLCNCTPAPSCNTAARRCSVDPATGAAQSCGTVNGTSTQCTNCDCQPCSNGCNANTGLCNRVIVQITTQITTQISQQVIGQIVAPAGLSADQTSTGTSSMFTDFFRSALGIEQ